MAALLTVAVGLAFADASIVVLALPEIYGAFDTTVVGVSWVITSYALVVAVAGIVLAAVHKRLRPATAIVIGLGVFAAASLLCGAAPSLAVLLAGRCLQGVGAALLLGCSWPVLAALRGGVDAGRASWALAATLGAAAGPAIGGLVTQLLTWRAVFLFQAPVAIVAAIALATATQVRTAAHDVPGRPQRGALVADIGYALVFGGLVGALFLGVLLVVEIWRFEPLQGAAVVSTLPLAALAVRPLAARLPALGRGISGAIVLALGLVGLAYLPEARAPWAAVALAICGAGFGLVVSTLGPIAATVDGGMVRSASRSVAFRHLGLVIGLVLMAPTLSNHLEQATKDATLKGTAVVLDARLALNEKVPLAWELRNVVRDTPVGQYPDIEHAFVKRGSDTKPELRSVEAAFSDALAEVLMRGFRSSFLIAALLALLAAVPAGIAVVLARSRPRGILLPTREPSATAYVALVAIIAAAVALPVVQHAAGAADIGQYVRVDPCTAPASPYAGSGLDGAVQRIALGGLNGAACELGTTREELVLSFDPKGGQNVTWDKATAEKALRSGFDRAVTDAEDRGTLPGFVAPILRFVIDHAPFDWLLNRLPLPG